MSNKNEIVKLEKQLSSIKTKRKNAEKLIKALEKQEDVVDAVLHEIRAAYILENKLLSNIDWRMSSNSIWGNFHALVVGIDDNEHTLALWKATGAKEKCSRIAYATIEMICFDEKIYLTVLEGLLQILSTDNKKETLLEFIKKNT